MIVEYTRAHIWAYCDAIIMDICGNDDFLIFEECGHLTSGMTLIEVERNFIIQNIGAHTIDEIDTWRTI